MLATTTARRGRKCKRNYVLAVVAAKWCLGSSHCCLHAKFLDLYILSRPYIQSISSFTMHVVSLFGLLDSQNAIVKTDSKYVNCQPNCQKYSSLFTEE